MGIRGSGKASLRKTLYWLLTDEQTLGRVGAESFQAWDITCLQPKGRILLSEFGGTARKRVCLKVRMGKGPKRAGEGKRGEAVLDYILSGVQWGTAEGFKQRHDHICFNRTLSVHSARASACH